jgi:hypothetical protein
MDALRRIATLRDIAGYKPARFVGPIKMYGPPLGVKQKLETAGSGLQECIRRTGGANSWP